LCGVSLVGLTETSLIEIIVLSVTIAACSLSKEGATSLTRKESLLPKYGTATLSPTMIGMSSSASVRYLSSRGGIELLK
jgi:hypothetical protein